VRSPIRFTDEATKKKTLLFYLPEFSVWSGISNSDWHLTQKNQNQWWIEELRRAQTPAEINSWQKDLASILLDQSLLPSEFSSLDQTLCVPESSINITVTTTFNEIWNINLCEPKPLTGKFLVHISTANKTISRKKESWFWAYTDRAYDGLYRDQADRYGQAFYSLKKEILNLGYVAAYPNFLNWLNVSKLKSLEVAYPKHVIYHVDFSTSALTPAPILPMRVDLEKITALQKYWSSVRPSRVMKGKSFKDAIIDLTINSEKLSVAWADDQDAAIVYSAAMDLSFFFPGKELASKILFIQNFYDKKITALAETFKKNLLHVDWQEAKGLKQSRLVRPDLSFKSYDAVTGLETKEVVWRELACYIFACNTAHEFLKFSNQRPPQLDDVSNIKPKEMRIEGRNLKIYPGQGVWWLEVGEKEYYLFAGQDNLWQSSL
jgi:hypothetical protein